MKHPRFFFQPSLINSRMGMTVVGMTTLLIMGLGTLPALAQSFTKHTLYRFTGTNGDGYSPDSILFDINGVLYGTTNHGGNGNGTIFSLDTTHNNSQQTLYQFDLTSGDGTVPQGGFIDIAGTLYSTALHGGINNDGIIYSYSPTTRTKTTLYKFTGANGDGANAYCGPITVNGKLYGVTGLGGTPGGGTFFSFDPTTGTKTTLFQFPGNPDGSAPSGRLLYINGTLYGTTFYGGLGAGTIFTINLDGTGYQTLYQFTDANGDGANPFAGLIEVNGILYGTTVGGGSAGAGTVFSYNPSTKKESTLYQFTGKADGGTVYAGLTSVRGLLYGVTYVGGNSDNGVVFSIDPTSKVESTVYQFTGMADGTGPWGTLLEINGTLYGTTDGGFSSTGVSTVFSLTPNFNLPPQPSPPGPTRLPIPIRR